MSHLNTLQELMFELPVDWLGTGGLGSTPDKDAREWMKRWDDTFKLANDSATYWQLRCGALENMLKFSTLKKSLQDKDVSYQPEWYEARIEWMKLQALESLL